MKLEDPETKLVLGLLADFQLQTLRRLKGDNEAYAQVRRLKADLTLAGTASAKLVQSLRTAK